MDCFDNFDPLNDDVPSFPFFELWSIVSEARILLAGSAVDDIRAIERHLDNVIIDAKMAFARHCLDRHVIKVMDEGSWELNYLPAGTAPTQQSIAHLLENWPDDANEPDYLTEDDLSDLDALRMSIGTGGLGDLQCEHSYLIKCAAVLALMKVAGCLESLKCPEEDLGTHDDGPIAARLVSAANDAIEAALILGYADEMAALAESWAEAAEDLAETMEEKQRRFSEERARKAAEARHRHFKPAIQFVQKEWALHREVYKNNKTDFARAYVGRVRNEYLDSRGDPLKVTEKTIREVWLSKPPPASKQAGQPVAG